MGAEDRKTTGGPTGPPDPVPVSSERHFRLLVHAVRDYAIFMLDTAGRVASWNIGAQRIKGWTEAEILGRNFAIFHTEEDRAAGRPQQALESALRDGTFRDERWRVRRDGSRFLAHVTITALHDEAGEHIGFAKVTHDLSEARQTEQALRESEERFRQLAENAREVFWLYNADFSELLYVSPAFERVWGRTVDELQQSPSLWMDVVHRDDRDALRGFLQALAARPSSLHFRINRGGEVRWLLARGFPVRSGAGEVIRIGGVTEDVTEEMEAEQQLRFLAEAGRSLSATLDYEETLRAVSRLAVPHVADWCVVDVFEDGEIRRLSVAHADPAREAVAWEVARRFPPDPSAPAGVPQVLRTGRPELLPEITDEALARVAQSDEHHRMMRELGLRSAIILPMRARGRTLGAITFIRAESGRRYDADDLAFAEEVARRAAVAVDNARLYREAREARGEAERRAGQEAALRRTAHGLAGTFLVDDVIRQLAENALTATNADGAFVKRIDIDSDEVIVVARAGALAPPLGRRGRYSDSFTRLAVESQEPLLVPSLAEAQGSVLADVLHQCEDCSAMVLPLLDAGEAIGALVLARLPHHRGFRPDELERARTFGDLASLAFRKIHLLQESEGRREELEEAIESRSRLIRGFTHDLKNPLGAADGYLQLIEGGIITDPDRVELSISRARRAIRTALDLINDLSQFSQVEAGHITVAQEPVDVRLIATELVEEYRAQAEAKGLAISCSMPDTLHVIASDSTRIRQVLGNLVSNAVKYTDGGEVRVQVAGRRGGDAPGPGRWVTLTVADTGIGIARDQQHLLFREFSRIAPGAGPGIGLGLAISQRVASALGGCIMVQSEAGQGATFTLWLPADEQEG